jgi:Acyl-CoA synthetases (AMP-forming)/AMP-acid ligases II
VEKLIEITVGSLLDDMARKYPDHDCALYTDRPFRKTYSEFNEICNKVAKSFLKMGIKKGDHVAIWATNVPEWLITLFASAKIGAVLVTVNTNYKVFELEYLLKQSDSNTLVLLDGFKDSNYIQIINELCPDLKNSEPGKFHSEELPFLKNIISVSSEKHPGMFNWDEIIDMGSDISDEELYAISNSLNCHDVINMQYTSGTTGFPKGVMLTHYNIVNNGMCIGDCMHFTYEDRLCIPVPFFHCFGLVLAIMACVTHGTTMVPVDYYSPLKVMNAIQSERCTAVHGVPTMYIAMLEHPDFSKYDFSSLRTGIMSGSPCPIKVMEAVVEKMNMKDITIPYGQTEASPVCTQTRIGDSLELRVSTVGRALPFIECKIVDPETNQDLPDGVPGEFVARGYNVMKGYYKMPEATAQAIDADGWLHTGDLATRDENGYYKITGRIKDMIIRGGENIYPKEIEEFL